MALQQLLSQTNIPAPNPAGTGPIVAFAGALDIRRFQFNVGNTGSTTIVPFSGTVEIRGSDKPNPGAGDFQVLASVDFTGHSSNFTVDLRNSSTSIQVILVSAGGAGNGSIAVFGDGSSGALQGGTGTTTALATAVVTTNFTVAVNGQFVSVNAPVVAQISSDDVSYAKDVNKTVTDKLCEFDLVVGGISASGTSVDDIALLAGQAVGGLTGADFTKLSLVDATAAELNFTIGGTSAFQAQIDALDAGKVEGAGVDLTGLTVSATDFNTFFDVAPTVFISDLNTALTGLSASAGDLNGLLGTAGQVTPADFIKLGDITASAAEINILNSIVATAAEINILAGATVATADLNALTGFAGTGVTVTELGFLTGLTENVQVALDGAASLPGLTSSVDDLNLVSGAFAGTGAFSGGALTSAEFAHLDGISSNIQTQLDSKRNTADTVGIGEITGASITTIELNYSSGLVANIQAQIDGLGGGFLSLTGGTMTGPLCFSTGTAAAPSLCFAAATTTGMFYDAPAIGFTIAGIQVGALDATSLVVGDTSTSGQAFVRGSGFNEANPVYSFLGDLDTGAFWPGADRYAISAGGETMLEANGTTGVVTVGGPVATNNSVTVSGILDGEKLLGTSGTITAGSLSGIGDTAIYTVPAGRTAIITKLLMVLETVAVGGDGGLTSQFRMNVGFTGALFDEIVDNLNNPTIFSPGGYSFSTGGQVMPLGFGDNTFPAISGAAGADYGILAAADVLTASVKTLADFDTYSFTIHAFGFEF